jgi:UDP-N-acetylmuramyl pentapeptide phosphotransferase/UDP-N-acetylglucosamine-1-phosphate transferase
MTSRSRRLLGAVVASGGTALARQALQHRPPGGPPRWVRTNHRGEPISLLEGPAVAVGLVCGLASGGVSRRTTALVLATGGSAVFGVIDDLAEDTTERSKGLRGHLRAARRGRLTTGALKVLGIGTTGLVTAALLADRDASPLRRAADVLTDGALVAASANLVNLLDLRPGRALKVSAVLASVLTASGSEHAPAVVGAATTAWAGDLAERDMLGDCGANALGALLGAATVATAPRPVRATVLAVVLGLTVVSERVSFSRVIAGTPWLHALDMIGRRPVDTPAGAGVPVRMPGSGAA